MSDPPTYSPENAPTPETIDGMKRRFRPAIFFPFLLGPAVFTLLGSFLPEDAFGYLFLGALVLALAGGIVCAVHVVSLYAHLGIGAKIGIGFLLSSVFAVVSGVLCCGGCAVFLTNMNYL